MTIDVSPVLLIVISGLVGLVLIPLGLPGLWVILLGIVGYGWLTDFQTMSATFLIVIVVLAILGEVFEAWIGFRYAQKYGGSKRAGWPGAGGRGGRASASSWRLVSSWQTTGCAGSAGRS